MSQAQQKEAANEGVSGESPEPLEASASTVKVDPDLSIDYVNAEGLMETESVFRPDEKRLNRLSEASDRSIYAGPEESAEILEHYIGQFFSGDLDEVIPLRIREDGLLSDVNDMDGVAVLRVDYLEEGYENQYLDRENGKVSREVVELLDEGVEPGGAYLRYFDDGEGSGRLVVGS
ncbi:MAG: hypothetical protein ACLFTA_01780 [Candidatus Nanohaloarchaea archaeon]